MRVTRRPLVLTLFLLALVVFAVDQLTKVWAVANLSGAERTPLLGDLLGLSLLYNPGAALSFATGMTWVFTVAAVVVTVVIVRVANRLGSRGWTVALGLLLGGALGNLADRLLRQPGFARGHVVDFIAYGRLFVGNVADIAIVTAAVLVVLLTLRGIGVDGRRGEESAAGRHALPHAAGDDALPDETVAPEHEPRGAHRADALAEDG
ncbi:MAG TPA: signal peptidase II [Actinotalea sp.]